MNLMIIFCSQMSPLPFSLSLSTKEIGYLTKLWGWLLKVLGGSSHHLMSLGQEHDHLQSLDSGTGYYKWWDGMSAITTELENEKHHPFL